MKLRLILPFFLITLSYGQSLPSLNSLNSNLPGLNNLNANLPYLEIRPMTVSTDYQEIIIQRQRSLLIEFYRHHGNRLQKQMAQINYHGPIPRNFIQLFLFGIAQGVETANHHSPYQARNRHSTAHGKYQITDGLWQEFSYRYCDSTGAPRHVLPRTPANQELIASLIARDMYRRHKLPGRSNEQIARWMAREWYGGLASLNQAWETVPHPENGNRLSYQQYADKVIRKMKQINPNLTFKKTKKHKHIGGKS